MKICDSCFFNSGKNVPAVVLMAMGPETYDLCASCADSVRQVISQAELDQGAETVVNQDSGVKRGRPRKKIDKTG